MITTTHCLITQDAHPIFHATHIPLHVMNENGFIANILQVFKFGSNKDHIKI
jgi:hypothetical protein